MTLLKRLGLIQFKPLPGLSSGRVQTIASFYFPYNPFIDNSNQHIISLIDGDKLIVLENRPKNWAPKDRIILLIHGLTGSCLSKYFIRLTKLFTLKGFLVIRMNLRGAGAGQGFAKRLYHSGQSEDPRAVLHWLATQFPHSPVTQIGFSIGANLTLKMAGEKHTYGNLDSIVAVSPPLDLATSVQLIIKKENKLFNYYFVKELIKAIKRHHQMFPDLPTPDLKSVTTLYEIDEFFTAPHHGFRNAEDYYSQSSSWQFLKNITLPTLILYAKDDPFISHEKFFEIPPKENLDVLITEKGGHVGWLGYTDQVGHYRWMDKLISTWVSTRHVA